VNVAGCDHGRKSIIVPAGELATGDAASNGDTMAETMIGETSQHDSVLGLIV
jgi:hypothetical protein